MCGANPIEPIEPLHPNLRTISSPAVPTPKITIFIIISCSLKKIELYVNIEAGRLSENLTRML